MEFDPFSISQDDLHAYRRAAEQAWGDDTRHESYIGHPQPSAGQCYVTSRWLTSRLGGHVGVKNGHYVWISPDKQYAIDLTGDQNSYSPEDLSNLGVKLDAEDEGWQPTEDQQRWRPGPVLYKQTSHPLFKGFRIKSFKTENPRVKLFRERADQALENPERVAKTADLLGADPYPGEEPQALENQADERFMHDEPDYEPGSGEYNFFYANGQLHVSPLHDHDELRGHTGVGEDHVGPMAAGFVTLDRGRATWHVQGNIALSGFARQLKDYTKQVGWQWGGLTDLSGEPVDDTFAPKKSLYLRNNETGDLVRWIKQGNTALVGPDFTDEMRAAMRDLGFKVAEYPGGSNMTDKDMLINHRPLGEDLEMFNNGPFDAAQPEHQDWNEKPTGTFRCPECGKLCPNFDDYLLHRKGEEPERDFDDDGHFPEMDYDVTIPPHFHPREPTVMPLASVREARRVEGFDLYADLWGYNSDEGYVHYGAFRNGELLGYATVRPDADGSATVIMVQSAVHGRGIGTALLRGLQRRYKTLISKAASDSGERLMARCGMVAVGEGLYKWSAGQQPKDMIDKPLPFIYDIDKDKIFVGFPGTRTSDIPGQFTPGGIVEGEYNPGGKVVVTTDTNMPWTVRHMLDLWYWSHPHMQVTGLEQMDANGQTTKLATTARTAASVGQHIRQVAASDPAVWQSYQALRKAGGKVYAVGGVVRDALLQKESNDVDLMVTGLPAEVVRNTLEKLPGRVDITGKDFGVFRYRTKGYEVEIALPRRERSTGDRRVDFDVQVDHTMPVEDDLLRRDFTVNSMAVDLDTGQLVDPFGGAEDIERRRLRTTHPSSFQEDPTRMVRALVASSRHGLTPDERTRQELTQNASRLDLEARERIQKELDKLFKSQNPAGAIRLAQDTGLLRHIFPEVAGNWDFDQRNPHHNLPLGEHLLSVLENTANESGDPDLRLAALLHDIGKPASAWTDSNTGFNHYYRGPNGQGDNHEEVGARDAEARLRALKYPTARVKRITHLIAHHMFPAFSSAKGARRFLKNVGDDHADDLLTLRYADQRGKGQSPEEIAARTSVDQQRGLVEQVRAGGEPTSQAALAINGNDLIAMGIRPGPALGQILRQLTDDVIEDPRLNNRDALLQRAQEYVAAQPA